MKLIRYEYDLCGEARLILTLILSESTDDDDDNDHDLTQFVVAS